MHSATRSSKASNFALCWRRMVPITTMLLIKFNFLYRCCKAPGQELSQVHLGNTCPPPVPNSHSRNISRRGRGDPCTHPPPPPEPAPGGKGNVTTKPRRPWIRLIRATSNIPLTLTIITNSNAKGLRLNAGCFNRLKVHTGRLGVQTGRQSSMQGAKETVKGWFGQVRAK